jgi:hypothetical protein
MTLKRKLIEYINAPLRCLNLQLETQTMTKREVARIDEAKARKVFEHAIYPVPACFATDEVAALLAALPKYHSAFDSFRDVSKNQVGYQFANGFYTSPDTEILYTLVRELQPKRILEIGCGNSTRITRQAILDGSLETKLTCLDPFPRLDVVKFADALHLNPVEDSPVMALLDALEPGDFLFIDTSHIAAPASDCAYIYCMLLPRIPPGVIVHIHDIFLPYEYPEHFVRGDAATWNEQYLVSIMLQESTFWDALWPGHYLQRTMPDFGRHFPHLTDGLAQSLWLRKR